MEALAVKLEDEINRIGIEYHYFKSTQTIEMARALADDIRQFCSALLQENVFGVEEAEYVEFQKYVVGVLEDYMESLRQSDAVLMADTLDYGLRELLNIFINTDAGEKQDE